MIIDRRSWLALAVCGALPWGFARGGAPGAVVDGSWRDPERSREIPWRLRLPTVDGPWPLVLYSHGLGGSREGGDAWGQAWRDAGIAVLHVQHGGSDTAVWREGVRALRAAASAQQLLERARDVRFVLDELARRAASREAPWTTMQADAIGMAGHSFGAMTTQALAGQRYPAGIQLADSRLRAFIALSPSSAQGMAGAFAEITRPFFAITGSLDGDPFGSYDSGEPRARVYEGLPPGQRALLWLDGADHMSFAGNREQRIRGTGLARRDPIAASREDRHHALVARTTALWWRAHLLGDDAARSALRAGPDLQPGDRFSWG
ncbi:MAG: hypothetical protein JNJ71_10370 [Rubrivivax sp.]|nr:hypothetical protein [Rubrivivax sp.]